MPRSEPETNFEGHPGRECGEHRTVGAHRAWCYDCTEWCYPSDDGACKGCELPAVRARAVAAEAGLAAAQAKIAAAMELHIPMQWDGGWRRPQPQTLCRECVVPWPCSTAAALDLPVDAPEAK